MPIMLYDGESRRYTESVINLTLTHHLVRMRSQ